MTHEGQCAGIIEPKTLQSVALDTFCKLLHRALEIASAEGSGKDTHDFPYCVRSLLGTHETYCLSSLLSDEVIRQFDAHGQLTARAVTGFCRSNIGSLSRVNLASCPDLDEHSLCLLLQHPLLELTLSVSAVSNSLVRWKHLEHLAKSPASSTLRSLAVQCDDEEIDQIVSFKWLAGLTHLVRLDLHDMFLPGRGKAIGYIAEQLPNLAILNLARTAIVDLQAGNSNLKAITLSDLPLHRNRSFFKHLLEIQSLVSLDISKYEEISMADVYFEPDMAQKLSKLPCLRYLDLSGHLIFPSDLDCFDPPHQRMKFLGLLATRACRRVEFNCDMVSGDADEQQFLASLKTYTDRNSLMEYALHKLFAYAQDGHLNSLQEDLLLALLLLFERRNPPNTLLLPGSACLWHLTKKENKGNLSTYTLKRTIVALVKLLERQLHELGWQTVKNCALCLCNFLFPEEVEFIYTPVLKLLVRLLNEFQHGSEELVQRVAISLMNGIVWQVSLEQKVLMKDIGGIEASLRYIEGKVVKKECDQALEMAWSFLWNVTDETPENNANLLKHRGLKILTDCYRGSTVVFEPANVGAMTFTEEGHDYENFQNVLRNMLGALGNVAEVQALRPKLIVSTLLDIFMSIFHTVKDLEVQYNISGIIANLAMEDELLWHGVLPTKDHMLHLIEECVDEWDLGQQRNIQYRSLKPIVAVVNCHDERVTLWGVWALANLCQVYPSKYCPMLRREGGVEAVCSLYSRAETARTKRLAHKVIEVSERDPHVSHE